MNFYDRKADKSLYYCNLPHWRQDTVCYFVTFRTVDSLPKSKLVYWIKERDLWQAEHPEPRSEQDMAEYHKMFSNKMELWLDQGFGKCLLKHDAYKQIVLDAIFHFANQRYRLWCYTVAANHVHLLIEPLGDEQLADIIISIKVYTAKCINKLSGESGPFWQREYFDHIVRCEEQYNRFVRYIKRHDQKLK